jgi:2,4-dienoyl-CoA reductase (NADPH2)
VGEVHCYSTEIDGELVLFDSGPPTADAFDSLNSQIDLSRLKYLFITHCHIDHSGLVSRIAANSDARIFIPRNDTIQLRRHAEYLARLVQLLSDIGCDEQTTGVIREKTEKEHLTVNIPERCEIVEESDLPASLGIEWLSCPGHSQSDLVYIHGKHAITGDTLLRNVFQVPILDLDRSTFATRFRNYDAYCQSIVSLQRLRGYQIHPGHRWHLENVDATIIFYVRKILERAAQVQQHAAVDSIFGLVSALFGSILKQPFFVHMKISEIIFVLDFLANPGQLQTALEHLGLFTAISDQYHAVVRRINLGPQLEICPAWS